MNCASTPGVMQSCLFSQQLLLVVKDLVCQRLELL